METPREELISKIEAYRKTWEEQQEFVLYMALPEDGSVVVYQGNGYQRFHSMHGSGVQIVKIRDLDL
jgi:hypothetical protein